MACAGDSGGAPERDPNGSGTGGATPGDGGTTGSGGEGTGGVASGGMGTGGAASGGTGGAGTGGGSGTVDCSSLPLCTDFESDAPGAVPAGFTANLNYNSGTNPMNVTVTTEDAYRGSQSVKVIGTQDLYGIEYANPGDAFYLRTWLKVVGLTNGNPAIVGVGQDPSAEMRMRLLKNGVNDFHAVAANASLGGDGISPVNSNGGLPCDDCVPLPADWFCLEMHVDRTSETLQMWVDGEQAVNVVNNAPWSGGATWPASMDVLRIGSMSLQGGGATVFIDDVALGPSRIGCE